MTRALKFLITGAAGFIGSAVARHLIANTPHEVCAVDKLTYAGNLANIASIATEPRFRFSRTDICDAQTMRCLFEDVKPDVVMHLAAESHVDRSIDGPAQFIQTNIVGTYVLLEEARRYWQQLPNEQRSSFRFHHISTDEVFGSLGKEGLFLETTPYQPRSPYSASKASADHLVRAWHHTYGLPTVVSNCSNNYGPYHFPEKLIPLAILNAFEGKRIPVYGDGSNVRDWLYVEDHARALVMIALSGRIGESYNVGGSSERTNLQVVHSICDILDALSPHPAIKSRIGLIEFVADRPGHDRRYAIDAGKVARELAWAPTETFETGVEKTVRWYLNNRDWWHPIRSASYAGQRLGRAGGDTR